MGGQVRCLAAVLVVIWLLCDVAAWSLIFIEHERVIRANSDIATLYRYLPIHKKQ